MTPASRPGNRKRLPAPATTPSRSIVTDIALCGRLSVMAQTLPAPSSCALGKKTYICQSKRDCG